MTGNYDITIQSTEGSVTFYGSRVGSNGERRTTGYAAPLNGLGDPGRRTTSTVKSGADGGLVAPSDQQYDMRQLSLDAFAMSSTATDIELLTASIRAAMPIRETVLVLVTTPQGRQYGANMLVTRCAPSLVYANREMLLRDYTIELLGADPAWYDYTNGTMNTALINKIVPGGIQWTATGALWGSTGLPWTSGIGNTTIVNTGSETVYPTITITGTVHNPIITNVTTSLAFQLNITTSTSDVIVIDMDGETVTLNGTTIMNNITTKNWWGLMVGNNTINYNSSTTDDTAQVVMTWRNRYMEII